MQTRWDHAFTIVELTIVIVVLAILATISVLGYNGIRENALGRTAQSDLEHAAAEMTREYQREGEFPSALPSDFKPSKDITLTVARAGAHPFYSIANPVQNGVLLAQICQDLINEGVGKGVNQGGVNTDYITGCGNWNHDSMQVTGWDTKKWDTPVTSQQLLDYANNFTVSGSWNKIQETVVKNFYTQLVERLLAQGGSFPIASFWDYWATPSNGGVMNQPLESNPKKIPYYCVEAKVTERPEIIWHVTEDLKIVEGAC